MAASSRGIAYPLFERVEHERALKGWSSTRLQRESGVARSTLYKWQTQNQPPLPATVNAVADALGIERPEALRLAGILSESPVDMTPQCIYEQEILANEEATDADKIQFIRAHRRQGHCEWCRPAAPGQSETGLARAR